MKYTFSQLAAGVIGIILIIFLSLVYFLPSKGTNQEAIIIPIITALSVCLNFLFGSTAGSQGKDETIKESNNNLVDALQKSTPVTKNI